MASRLTRAGCRRETFITSAAVLNPVPHRRATVGRYLHGTCRTAGEKPAALTSNRGPLRPEIGNHVMMPRNPPLALIASGNEWLARSFESVLSANGYAVLRAFTPGQALAHARLAQPDAIFVDGDFHATGAWTDLCSTLRADPSLSPSTPIVLITTGPTSRQERLNALRAGAWEVIGLPLDAEALLPQLETFVRARLAADRYREEGLLDPDTGLYNMQGLLRRVRELGAAAQRHQHALACIVFGPVEQQSEESEEDGKRGDAFPAEEFAALLRRECRASDVIGRLGRKEFVIIAPDTGPAGALILARKITAAADSGKLATGHPSRPQLRAGFFAVSNFATAAIQPVEMLVRATMALRRSRARLNSERIISFAGAYGA